MTDDNQSTDAPVVTFSDLNLRPELLKSLDELGYEEPTPIQREAIPHIIAGRDLLGQAATGTGKTAAFALPVLHGIDPNDPVEPVVLVLVPTRELAMQVSEAMFRYGRALGIKVAPVYGGQPIHRQLHALDRGVHVVVGTPGRVLDHIGRGSLPLENIRTVVLDEADEMLDMGFADDIEAILQTTPETRQTVLFSATLPPRINSIAKRYQRDPVKIQIARSAADASGKALIRQKVYVVPRSHKPAALGRILDIEAPGATIVFCRTRTEVDTLTETMNGRGYRAEALHGGMDQAGRDRVMSRLREGTAELLVATDVAARGLDVDLLTHVVNYDVPSAAESYVHRIGRVGRAGREGVAITLAEPREQRLLANIERLTKQKLEVEKVPSVADLRVAQISNTVATMREAAGGDDLIDYEEFLDQLVGEFDLRTLAMAGIKLAHAAGGATVDENEIPDASGRFLQNERGRARDDRGNDRGDRGRPSFDKRSDRGNDRGDRGDRFAPRSDRGDRGDRDAGRGRDNAGNADTGFLFLNIGRKAGIRPGDLVGAIANECGISGRDIGPIRISEMFSVVGVPSGEVDDVISRMRGSVIRGKQANVRRYVD